MAKHGWRRRALRRLVVAGLIVVIAGALPAQAAPGDITTYAGGRSIEGAVANAVSVPSPASVARDGAGTTYFSTSSAVYKVSPAGILTTFAPLPEVYGGTLAVDQDGTLYVSGRNRLYRFSPEGVATVVAGTGTKGYSGDGGPATAAQLGDVAGFDFLLDGAIVVADPKRVRKIDTRGIITTLAGGAPVTETSGDAIDAKSMSFLNVYDVGVDSHDNIYVLDATASNDLIDAQVRKITPQGLNLPFAGRLGLYGGLTGPAAAMTFSYATSLAVGGPLDTVYIGADYGDGVTAVTQAGIAQQIAGGGSGEPVDGGPATGTYLNGTDVDVDASGTVSIAAGYNRAVYRVHDGVLTAVAGNGKRSYAGDGGPVGDALFDSPQGLLVDGAGTMYVADTANRRIRKISGGVITTVAGNGQYGWRSGYGDGGPATSAKLTDPGQLALGADGSLFFRDHCRVRKVAFDGTITTFAGGDVCGKTGDGGPATAATLCGGGGLAIASDGRVFVSGCDRVRVVAVDGTISTFAGGGTGGLGDGGPATAAKLSLTEGLSLGSDGTLYIADRDGNRVRAVAPSGIISTVAGTGTNANSGDGGPATSAAVSRPTSVLATSAGLHLGSSLGPYLRRVDTDGTMRTIAGTGVAGFSGDGGPASAAQIKGAAAIAMGSDGALYFTDAGNDRIRRIEA